MIRGIPDRQDALPFRNGQGSGILVHALPWERRLVLALGALLLACTALYVYFVMTSIVHVAARQELIKKVALAKTAVSSLESVYLAKTKSLTESYAHSIGFTAPSKKVFVERAVAVTLHDGR